MRAVTCAHRRGEYADTYRHCLDCGQEWVEIGGSWFEVEMWVQVSDDFLHEPTPAEPKETP